MASNLDDLTFDGKATLLEADLADCLRWLLVGAVAWKAGSRRQAVPHQKVLAMNTAFTQARALYEFFYSPSGRGDDARATDFISDWAPAKSSAYLGYMSAGRAANKRMFHLVYRRTEHAGGVASDESDHLKNQVVAVAEELVELTREFVRQLDPELRPHGQTALQLALDEAARCADAYSIRNPFR
jgi:hypothetical protein